jgi:hypothetical protein
MIRKVTLADCAAKIGDCLDQRLTHEQLLEWVRDAMMAEEIPPPEYERVMELLMDLSVSTPRSFARAAKEYRALTSPLVKGVPGPWKRN